LIFSRPIRLAAIGLAILAVTAARGQAADDTNDELVQTIVNLLGDKDKDLRAVGLEQVREQAKGPAATRRFAAVLLRLAPPAQVELLDALADRGDRAARPAVVGMLKSEDPLVRAAALRSLGPLGEANDVPSLALALAKPAGPENTAAAGALLRLSGSAVNQAIVAQLENAKPNPRARLLGVLAARRAVDAIPSMLAAARDADAGVRRAALEGLGQLARPEHVAALVSLLIEAPDDRQREAAERAITFCCGRIANPGKRADPLLAVYVKLGGRDRQTILPTLGRLGGPAVLKIVEAAIADADPALRNAGMRALGNWPDGSVAARLLELSKTAADAGHRRMALLALIRVAPLPDGRPPAEKLRLLKSAMDLAARDQDRELILKRAQAIRTLDTLRYVASYLGDPRLAQQACATIVELAHHRDLREPNQAEFHRLLDQVIGISKDAVVVDRARRYKLGQTFNKDQR
jgi:HEAT repeat protein